MPYDAELADRVRALAGYAPGTTEKRMFGGLAFLVDGHMAVAVGSDGLMVRVDPATGEALLGPYVRRTRMQGRELDGWVDVDGDALESDAELRRWVDRGVDRARSLPPRRGGATR